ncbi:hypothetical protein AB5J49_34455 [Streptomyces sp. R28]|uniref:ATP-binding protein n=1 Tax=Streptomyces sp. R28 TaxID=3238628 RepID=A0AB39Q6T5_9ACTN
MSTTPNPDEVTAELALNRALQWIDRPRETSAWLWIGGRAGSGRTALLREVVARHPGAAYVDGAGKSAEEVAREVATTLGVAAALDTFKGDIAAVARRISDDPVVVLANTQWAGRLRTSREPQRVVERVARALITFHPRGLRMRLLVEVDDAPGRADELGGRHLTLQGGFESMPALAEPNEDANLSSALDALALAEHRFVPSPVWSLLCSALGQDIPQSRLESLLDDPVAGDWIHRTDDGTGTPLISFKQEAAARQLRTQMPAEQARSWHAHAVTAMSAADSPEATRWYAARALAGHAAAAGRFNAFLEDTPAVTGVGHESLFEGFEAAFHARPIPQGTAGARLHYMARRGVQPSSQGEWLALLHLTLMQAEPTEEAAADRLLAAAGPVTLPWRTLWAEGVGAGVFSTDEVVSRPILRTLQIVHTPTGDVVTARTRREHIGTWDLATGAPRPEPDEAADTSDTTRADQGPKGWRPAGALSGEVDLPRMPEYALRGTRSGHHIALATMDGVCVVEINQSAGHEDAPGLLKCLVGTDTTLARADLPAQALAPTTD